VTSDDQDGAGGRRRQPGKKVVCVVGVGGATLLVCGAWRREGNRPNLNAIEEHR